MSQPALEVYPLAFMTNLIHSFYHLNYFKHNRVDIVPGPFTKVPIVLRGCTIVVNSLPKLLMNLNSGPNED